MNVIAEERTYEYRYTLTITRADLLRARFYNLDRLFIDDCRDGSIADKLLALETIARRIEEATQNAST